MRIYPPVEERFWSKVNKNGPVPVSNPELGKCWLWTAGLNGNGYGAFCVKKLHPEKAQISAHRFAWLNQLGEIPDGLSVLHKCDNPICVNPDHLFLGTVQDNSDDMVAKGRAASGDRHMSRLYPWKLRRGDNHPARMHPEKVKRGENHGRAKLTADDIRAIRARKILAAPTNRVIAKDYGVTTALIRFIVRGEIWKHVT